MLMRDACFNDVWFASLVAESNADLVPPPLPLWREPRQASRPIISNPADSCSIDRESRPVEAAAAAECEPLQLLAQDRSFGSFEHARLIIAAMAAITQGGRRLPEGAVEERRQRPRLPAAAQDALTAWLTEHREYPYATQTDMQMLQLRTGLTQHQVRIWLVNNRSRILRQGRRLGDVTVPTR
jgi:hypothetical protein